MNKEQLSAEEQFLVTQLQGLKLYDSWLSNVTIPFNLLKKLLKEYAKSYHLNELERAKRDFEIVPYPSNETKLCKRLLSELITKAKE